MKFSAKNTGRGEVQITLGIPLWVTKSFDKVGYQWRKWKYLASPDRCRCCNKKMFVRTAQIEHTFKNGRRLTVENLEPYVCRECTLNLLENERWMPRFSDGLYNKFNYQYWRTNKCAITDRNVRSYKSVEVFPHVDMIFCTMAWNHDYISKEAVIECVREGKIKTGRFEYKGKELFAVNHKGLCINDEGELL